MCMSSPKPPKQYKPAASPAPPLPVADEPDIGDGRKKENIKLFGKETPTYRKRGAGDEENQGGGVGNQTGGLRM